MSRSRHATQRKQSFRPDLPMVALMWENFGPTHDDRTAAAAKRLTGRYRVVGVEIGGRSATYSWQSAAGKGFEKITLFAGKHAGQVGLGRRLRGSWRVCRQASCVFLCHYEHPATFLLAVALRLAGKRVLVMNDSKSDDALRIWWREQIKRIFYRPYHGALVGSPRSREYLAGLGVPVGRIFLGYDGVSVTRVRAEAGKSRLAFEKRGFLIVARLVPEKNLGMVLAAYARYRETASAKGTPLRKLEICGDGPLKGRLQQEINALGLAKDVRLLGWVDSGEVAKQMKSALALILPSTVEPFGQVVAEAIAVGLPVLVNQVCGACDELVRDDINGFTYAPDEVQKLAELMDRLSVDKKLRQRLAEGNKNFVPLADTLRFAQGVEALIDG